MRVGGLGWSQGTEETIAQTLNLLGLPVSTFSKSRLCNDSGEGRGGNRDVNETALGGRQVDRRQWEEPSDA